MSDNLIARLEGLALSNGISLPLEAATALAEAQAEIARLEAQIQNGLKWCDLMDGPVSKSQFCNGQATAAQQIRAALSPKPAAPSACEFSEGVAP